MTARHSVDVRLDELSIELPPDQDVDRDEYLAGLVEELTRLLQTQGLPAAALRDREVVRLQATRARAPDSRAAGREAGRAIHQGMTQ
jgi:hypothetical protein